MSETQHATTPVAMSARYAYHATSTIAAGTSINQWRQRTGTQATTAKASEGGLGPSQDHGLLSRCGRPRGW
jgi:hypothetical protein